MSVTSIALGAFVSLALRVDPEVAKQEYFDSGSRYFEQGQYREAIIEYLNAVQLDSRFGDARYLLAEAYAEVDEMLNAYGQYIRAADLLPVEHPVQLKAASLLLASGQSEEAKDIAQTVLNNDPANAAARILLGNAMAGLDDLDRAISEIEEAIALDPSRTVTYANLGALQFVSGERDLAEAAFKRAVEIAPESIDVHRALGNYYWAAGRFDEAEQALKTAVGLDPENARANRSLATFLLITGRAPEAEPYLRVYADAFDDPGPSLTLADYYVAIDRTNDAIAILDRLTEEGISAAVARLAAILYADEPHLAHELLDKHLADHETDATALVAKARFLLVEGQFDDALELTEIALASQPDSVASHYARGLIQAARRENGPAEQSFNEVLRLNPRAAAAQVELSRLQLAKGQVDEAVQLAGAAVENDPANSGAHLMLGASLMMSGDLDGAQAEFDLLAASLPESAEVHIQRGRLQQLRGDASAASDSYERALTLDADAADAVAGLVSLDVGAGDLSGARARIDTRLDESPDDPELLMIAAKTRAVDEDAAGTEEMLKRAIEADPSALQTYMALGRLYALQGRLDEAVGEFERVAERQPDSVTAPTMIGMIFELQNDQDEARKWYERILDIDRRSPIAANNLAWIYANSGENLDVALSLAQVAKEQWPDEPDVSDTLGWIYYKKELVSLALPLFEECVEQEPSNPVFHYHLGLARLDNGEEAEGRVALDRALALQPDFDGATEARQALAALSEPAELQ